VRGGHGDAAPDDPRHGRQPERWLRNQAGTGLGRPVCRTKLSREGYGHRVVNASASGETTGGRTRAPARGRWTSIALRSSCSSWCEDGLRGLPCRTSGQPRAHDRALAPAPARGCC
jgi:hypothetical protein